MSFIKLFMIGTFVCLGIFLFATAPAELTTTDSQKTDPAHVEVTSLFFTVNAMNDAARLVYTRDIVGGGKAAGLKFGEDWDEPGKEKGPLPALFLRLVAQQLERRPEPLGLYLGSDKPINKSNLFSDEQFADFTKVKETHKPQFSISDEVRSVAMFPDFASAQPCVSCHNEHADSPKTDWKLGDIMGATTWSYPASAISESELLFTSRALHGAIGDAYSIYLDKAQAFGAAVPVAPDWPKAGNRVLPDRRTFMAAVLKQAGTPVAHQLLAPRTAEN